MAERIFERFEHASLQIEVSQIIIHKADQPGVVVHFFDADRLAGEDRARIDLFEASLLLKEIGCHRFGSFFLQPEMHAFVTIIFCGEPGWMRLMPIPSRSHRTELRGEFFNALNHSNLWITLGDADLSSTTTVHAQKGVPPNNTANERRNVQLALKLIF